MEEYWVDFSGYLKVKATSKTDAERKMWRFINNISLIDDFSDDVWDIDGIEKVERNENADN